LFYGNGCPHCTAVDSYFKEQNIQKLFDVEKKEVFYHKKNLEEFNAHLAQHGLSYDKIGVPFLIITSGDDCNYINGDVNIIEYFSGKLAHQLATCKDTTFT
jgi:glutaredoxin